MRRIERIGSFCFLLLLLLLWLQAGPACAAQLRAVAATSSVRAGEQVTVEVRVDSVTDLAGFQFNYSFDPAVLEIATVTLNGGFDRQLKNVFDNTTGGGLVAAYSLDSPPLAGTDVTLATLVFTAKGSGFSNVTLSNQILALPGGEEMPATIAAGAAITVMATNYAPIANAQSITTAEDTATAIILSATDADGGVLTYSIVAAPAYGTLSGAAPNLTYTPAANYHGSDSFTFKANDGAANSNVATVAITVTPVNDAPVAAAQTVGTTRNVARGIALAASDVDGDPLSYSIVAGPAHGTLSGTAPNVTYTPAAGYSGPDSFTFKANDGTADSNTATVSITVTFSNVAPVASGQAVTTAEDTAKGITLSATDADGDALTYSIVAAPAHGTLGGAPPNFTYTPAANYNGSDSLTFMVNDGTVNSNVATVAITITPVNDAPVAAAQAVGTTRNIARGITLAASDVDGDPLSYSIAAGPAHGTLSGTAPNVTYTPAAGYSGPDSFTFKANDGTADSNTATVSITVTFSNVAPVAGSQAVTTAEDTARGITLSATDADGDALTYGIVAAPAHGTLSGAPPNFTYTPAANYNGSDSFTFKANDGTADSNTATVSITITPVNDAPVASGQAVTTAEDTARGITLSATDVDGDALTYSIVAAPAHGTLSGTASNLTYTPAANYYGSDSLTFMVNDGTVNSNVATVAITITPVNDAPVAAAQAVGTTRNVARGITLTASDVDGDPLSYSIVAGPAHGTLSGTAPNVTYTPAAGYSGPDSFTFKANDGTADSNIATVSITVTFSNAAPVASGQAVTTAEDTAKAVVLSATDVDGDVLTYSIVAAPAHGTLSGLAPNLIYMPGAGYSGPDSFTFKANDGTLDSNAATVTIEIQAEAIAPTVDTFTLPATSTSLTVAPTAFAASDNSGAVTGYLLSEDPAQPSLTGPNWTATPTTSYTFATQGFKTLYAFARDASGNVSAPLAATVTITLPDTTAPTVDTFTLPAASTSLTVAPTAFAASDNSGAVTGYLLSEDPAQPALTGPNWTATPTTSYTFATQGFKTLYAFARDASGNVSAPLAATVTITLPDTTAPTVDTFTLPAASTSLTVAPTAFAASDDSGAVTGYLLSEDPAQPALTGPNWTATPTTSYTFATQGFKTLYAFARDASGNVSAPLAATVTITLPDTMAPTVDTFTLPAASTSLTVAPTAFTASDNSGAVTGYLLSENPAQPALTGPNWTAMPTASYTFATQGFKTLYAFARDASGNVSAPLAATVTITLPDTMAPTVDTFTLPAASTSLTVTPTAFTASDDSGAVTGYLLSENPAQPALTGPNWTAMPTTSYTFATQGIKTLNAFARDASGNVSAPLAATVTITLPDTTAPTVDTFTLPAASTSLTVAPTAFTASDDSGAVTGYLLSENPAQPALTGPNWTAMPTASYTFATQGFKTLNAFARDASGNVSAPLAATVTITLPDTTAPTVDTFTLPAASTSLTVAPTAFTASDDSGAVTGYLLSENPAQPALTGPNWTAMPTASYTFATQGFKTLNAFARDAAGNVSASLAATVSITLPVTYAVTLSQGENGTISGPATYTQGTAPTFTITPATGYHVADVTVNGASVGVVTSYTLPANTVGPVTIAAIFAPDTYLITAGTGPDGSVTPAGKVTVTAGGSQVFTITPITGYYVTDVLVDGVSVGPVLSYTFSNVAANRTIQVSFAAPDGKMSSTSSAVDIVDCVIAMRVAVGDVAPTPEQQKRGDVAPLVNGKPSPDGRLDLGDAVVILRKVVGLVTW